MNETLKGVAHIGAELAAAKADLQLEMERHRKTWRQLEQVKNAMRRIVERCEIFIDDEAEMSTASVEALMGIAEDALSLQAEPAPAQDELLPCPFCGQQDAFVEQLDSDASVVICQGMIDEHSACLARGPVGVQQSDMEDQPGRDAAIAEWNRRALCA